jgi:hypothetical protein
MDPEIPAQPMPPMPDENVPVVPVPAPIAKNPAAGQARAREELVWTAIYLGLALVIIGIVFAFLRLWTRRQTDCESTSLSLSSFHEMYENGEITEAEYQKIRGKMASKMKRELGIKPKEPPIVGSDGAQTSSEKPS